MLWEISLLIVAIAFLLLVIFLIPSLTQVRRTARSIEKTTATLHQSLPGILTNLDEITTHVASATNSVSQQVEGVSGVVSKVREMVDDVADFEKTLRTEVESPIVEILGTLTGIVKGVRAFLDALKSRD